MTLKTIMFNLQKFSSNKIPATKARVLVDKVREKYATRIIKDGKINKNIYLDLNKKNLYVISEINNMFSSSEYKELNILNFLLKSSVPIQNIPIGLVSGYLFYNPMTVLEAIGNAYSYKNFRNPNNFSNPFQSNTETKNKNDFKNILESIPVEWINFSLKSTNVSDIIKVMCEINYDFAKINKDAIKSLKSNKNIDAMIGMCPNLKTFLGIKR